MTENKTIEINEKTPLLMIAGPMFVELFLNILLNNIDTMMLSHYSENAVGGVGNANQMLFLLIIMFNIIATATSVVVAQYLGAKQYDKMNMIYTLAVAVNLCFGILLSAGIVAGKGIFMQLLKISPEMQEHTGIYLTIVGGGMFFLACYNVMLQILRCNGYTRIGMYISVIINLINIAGNYIFLYGPLKYLDLGAAGVAIATVAARAVALVAAIGFFYAKKIGRLSLRYLNPFPGKMLSTMIRIGLPSAVENLCYNLYQMVLLSLINGMGNDAVNAKVYCSSLISFGMVFSNASAMATQIIVGHLVGAGNNDAAYKRVFSSLRVSLPVTVGLAGMNWIMCPFTLRLFTQNQTIIHIAYYIMLADILVEAGRCLNMTLVNSLKAAGDYLYPLFVGIFTMWGLGALLGYTYGVVCGLGVAGIFLGTATDELVRGMIVLRRWRKKQWLGKAIVEQK